jgi:hypothetical protein
MVTPVNVIWVALVTLGVALDVSPAPKATVAPDTKFVPVMVSVTPEAPVVALLAAMVEMVGTGLLTVKVPWADPEVGDGLVTLTE